MHKVHRGTRHSSMSFKLVAAAFLGALCPLVMSATPATADADEKYYPGFMCMQAGSETGAFNRSDYRITRTNSTGSGRLLCPIVRDRVASPGTGYDSGWGSPVRPTGYRARVSTYRSPASGNLSCTLYARSHNGGIYSWDTEWANVGQETTELWVGSSGSSAAAYHLACNLPVNSGSGYTRLHNYWVSE